MISDGDPEFSVDSNGLCNYCRFAASQANDRRVAYLKRPWVMDQIRKAGEGKEYDCLVGISGGVDSSYVLHLLKENGLRPLAFSVDNGWNTKESDENMMRMVEGLQVPFIRYKIDLGAFKRLQRAFIQAGVKNIEIPTDHMLYAATYEMANKYGIKMIISGGNWQTEGTMPKSYGYNATDLTHIQSIGDTKGLPTLSLLKYLYYRNIKRIRVINLLDFVDYNREKAIETLKKLYGYKPYGEKHSENIFTKWFQDVYLPEKFGIDKRRPHLSSLIHSGQITRKQAMQQLEHFQGGAGFTNEIIFDWKIFPKHEYTDYPTNEKWVQRWQTLFNFLKKYGYSR